MDAMLQVSESNNAALEAQASLVHISVILGLMQVLVASYPWTNTSSIYGI